MMICPKCGKKMRDGYVFSSKDGALSFADEVPGTFENAKNVKGFAALTELKVGGRAGIAASCCDACRVILIHY